jgi:polyhydroxyalkanoate synthesis regulator phasin
MGKSKRDAAPERGSLIRQARATAGNMVKEAQRRMPPDLLKRLETNVREGQRSLQAGLGQVQAQLGRTASKEDLERLSKRVDELAKQVERLSRAQAAAAPAPSPVVRRSPAGPTPAVRRSPAAPTPAVGGGSATAARKRRPEAPRPPEQPAG